MISKDDDVSPPERDRTANRRWIIGIVVSLVFGIFGAVMAMLSYMDRERPYERPAARRAGKPSAPSSASPPAASPPAASPLAASPHAESPALDPGGDRDPDEDQQGKGDREK